MSPRRNPLSVRWRWWYGVVALVLVFLVAPWPAAREIRALDGFDPVLATVKEQGYLPRRGRITLSPQLLSISVLPHSQPTVHLLTTEGDFRARFAARVLRVSPQEVYPVQIKLWNPSQDVALEAWFSPLATSRVYVGYRVHDRWLANQPIGGYRVGEPVMIEVWRTGGDAGIRLAASAWTRQVRVTPRDFPALFAQDNLSLTTYGSSPGFGSATAEYSEFQVTVPGVNPYGIVLDRGAVRTLAAGLGLIVAIGLLGEALRRRRGGAGRGTTSTPMKAHWESLLLPVGLLVVVLLSVPLSFLGSHPYDMYSNQLWSYVAARHGLAALYTVAAVGTEGFSHGGDPYAAAAFPYPPLIGYVFKFVGEIYQGLGGTGWVSDTRLATGLKLTYLSFHLLGAVLVNRLLSRTPAPRWGRVAALVAYLFNPVILWGAVVWGQVDTLLLLMLLVAFVGIEERKPTMAWLGILASATVKQTGLPFAVFFAVVLARQVGGRDFLRGFLRSVLWFYLLVAPLIWSGIHPVSFVYPTWRKFLQFGTVRWMEVSNAVVARDGFNLWTLITYFSGARGAGRMAYPDYVALPGLPLTYVAAARLLTAGLTVYVGALLFRRLWARPASSSDRVLQGTPARLLLVATFLLGVVFLSTRVTERYYTFGLAFLTICAPLLRRPGAWLSFGALTASALVALYGYLVQIGVWYPGLMPRLIPEGHPVNALALRLYTSDGWISVFSLLTLLAIAWLLVSVHAVDTMEVSE